MRRDWPLVAAGFGIVVLSACFAVLPLLAYRPPPEPCPPPPPPGFYTDGCYREPGGFDWWIDQPSTIGFFAVALLVLLARGDAPRAQEPAAASMT